MNAKDEFLKIFGKEKVIAATIEICNNNISEILYRNYDHIQLEYFLSKIDVEYDDGYGGQELYGTIWCDNGIWYNRGEYDGSEWWQRNKYPDNIPISKNNDRSVKLKRILK